MRFRKIAPVHPTLEAEKCSTVAPDRWHARLQFIVNFNQGFDWSPPLRLPEDWCPPLRLPKNETRHRLARSPRARIRRCRAAAAAVMAANRVRPFQLSPLPISSVAESGSPVVR